jgi:hypothetical protein
MTLYSLKYLIYSNKYVTRHSNLAKDNVLKVILNKG